MALTERSLSHTRDPSAMTPHGAPSSSSSRAARDPRIDERVRRVSPEQLTRDRYRLGYEKCFVFTVIYYTFINVGLLYEWN